MAHKQLATYLNDHLAGAVGALELLKHMETVHAGTSLEQFFADLRVDIDEDRHTLEGIMDRLQIAESHTRQATAWLGEKASQLKLSLGKPSAPDEALRQLEVFEVLSLGIEGKRGLWLALEAAEVELNLQGVDYQRLVQRAEEQRQRVEEKRLEAARAALVTATKVDHLVSA